MSFRFTDDRQDCMFLGHADSDHLVALVLFRRAGALDTFASRTCNLVLGIYKVICK